MEASRRRGPVLGLLMVALGVLTMSAPAQAAPTLPKSVKKIDRKLSKAAKRLGKKETARLRASLRSAGRALRRGRRCAAAKALTRVVARSRKLEARRAKAAGPVARAARGLSRRLVARQRRRGACGLRIRVRIKRSLKPSLANLPPRRKAAKRPVFRLQGSHATADFAEREIVFSTRGRRGLARLLRRTRGRLVASYSSPNPSTRQSTTHLIRLPASGAATVSASRRAELVDDLRRLDPLGRGRLTASSGRGLNTLATAADAASRGMHVGLNPVVLPDATPAQAFPGQRFLDDESIEGITGTSLSGLGPGGNAFGWSFFGSSGTNAYGTGNAWKRLEVAGRLAPLSIPLAIIDGGFVTTFGLATTTHPTGRGPGRGGSQTHGFDVAQTAGARADDNSGSAGSAGPVADLRMIDYSYDGFSVMTRIYDAIRTRSRVINLSVGSELDALVSWASIPVEDATQEAVENNILPIGSAGNDNRDVDAEDCFIACWEEEVIVPCELDGVLCVGGVNVDRVTRAIDAEEKGSNYGVESCGSDVCDVEIFGPYRYPIQIHTATGLPTGKWELKDGTSFASPYVAGVAALVFAANPRLSQDQVRATLIDTAHPSSDDTVPRVVNADRAVASNLPDQGPVVGIATPRPGPVPADAPTTLDGVAVTADGTRCCSYRWTSSTQGFLGDQATLGARLQLGTHLLTLEATDDKGRKGSKSVLISVEPRFSRQPSTLTISCPGTSTLGVGVTVSGALNPRRSGATIRIEFRSPSGTTRVEETRTDANGGYSLTGGFLPALGRWNIKATFAGDEMLLPTTSRTCVTEVNLGVPIPRTGPDLTISTVGASSVTVTNSGDVAAPATELLDSMPGAAYERRYPVPALGPGHSTTIGLVCNLFDTRTVAVDPDNIVDESNEANNTASSGAHCPPPK